MLHRLLLASLASTRQRRCASSDLVTVVKLREGIDGVAGVRALLSNEVHVLAADASGAVASYDSAWSTIKVYLGLVDDTANWTLAATASAGVDSALSYPGGVARVSVSAMSVDSGYVEISATRAGYTTPPPFRFNVVKVRAGSNGICGASRSRHHQASPSRTTEWTPASSTTSPA